MANSTTPLTGLNPLQIKIYRNAAARPENPSSVAGVISFDEVGQRVGINGQWYGADQADVTALTSKVTGMLNALTSEGLVTASESGGTTTYAYSPLTSTGITLAQGVNPTISNLLTALETEISAVEAIASTAIQQVTVNNVTLTRGTGTASNNVSGSIKGSDITVGGTDDTYKNSTVDAAISAVDGKITTEIEKLDATVGSTSIESGKHVAVQVIEADGKLTGVTVTENIAGNNITVGGTGALNSSTIAEAINSLNSSISSIDKDSFVNEGTLVYFTADSYGEPAVAVEGRHTTDYTLNTEYSTTKDSTHTKPYIKLVVVQSNGTNNPDTEAYIYIKATSLVDVYTSGSASSDAVQIAVSNNQITASLKNGGVHTKTQTAGADGLALSVTTTDGAVSAVTGSIAANTYDAYGSATTAETNAKAYADTICSWSVIDTAEQQGGGGGE